MIETTLSRLITSYLWILLCVVGLIWLFGEWRRRQRWRREARHQVICRLCNETFREETGAPLVHCPRCDALNERRRPRSI